MGLGAMEMAGALMAVVIGVSVVSVEVQRKTILPTLAKPLRRSEFCLGRYLGLAAVLTLNCALMLLLLTLVLALAGYTINATVIEAALLIAVELMLLAAVALLFGSFSTPILAAGYSLSIFLIGHLLGDLRAFAERSRAAGVAKLAHAFYALLPDLALLHLK